MTSAFDGRLITLTVQLQQLEGVSTPNPIITYDQNYYILATGIKRTDGGLGECAFRIDNIAKATRDMLVAKTSPYIVPRLYANITLSVGRQSKGTFVLYQGQAAAANPTQPPDIGLTFTSLTMGALLGNMGTLSMGPTQTLMQIAQQIANGLINPVTGQPGIPLDYQATANPTVNNYNFTGPLINQVQRLGQLGPVLAYIDNNKLIVTDINTGRSGGIPLISAATGMVGVPEVTEVGVRVKVLILQELSVGQSIQIQSNNNPAANGTFIIFQLGFEVSSWDNPFYYIIEARAPNLALGYLR